MKQMAVFVYYKCCIQNYRCVNNTWTANALQRIITVFWNSQKISVNTHFHLQSKVDFKTINTLNEENKSSFLHHDETY